MLVDIAKANIPGLPLAYGFSEKFIKENPNTIFAILKSVAEGVARTRSDPATAKRAIAKYTQTDDTKIVDDTYDFYAPYFVTDLALKPEQLKTWFSYLDEKEYPQAARRTPRISTTIPSSRRSRNPASFRSWERLDNRVLRSTQSISGGFMFKVLVTALTILGLSLGASTGSAQERVRVGWAAMTASHTPLWVAQDKGFLAKQGLAVESIFFGAGPPAMQALVAGDLDIVVTSGAQRRQSPSRRRRRGDDPVDHPDFYRPYRQRGEHHDHRAVTRQDRLGQSFRQHLGNGVAAVAAPTGHRSGKGRDDRARGRESRAARVHFQRHFSVYDHERTVCQRGRKAWAAQSGQHGQFEDSAPWQRCGDAGGDHQEQSADGRQDLSAASPKRFILSRTIRKRPRQSSASTLDLPIPKASSALIVTTWRFCWTCRMPIRWASRRCSTTWRRKIPRPRAADPKSFVDASFVQEMEISGVYQAAV